MKPTLAVVAMLLSAGHSVFAHRLDEYLQGTIISVEKNRVDVQITLTPGVAVFPILVADIDLDANGTISEIEQRAYANRVLGDLSIAIDGHPLKPHLLSAEFPPLEEMKAGAGEIRIEFDAGVPAGGAHRKLTFENHHQSGIAAYQVNCLVSRDPSIQIRAQHRNYSQSFYELDFEQAAGDSTVLNLGRLSGTPRLRGTIALLVFAWVGILWKRHV